MVLRELWPGGGGGDEGDEGDEGDDGGGYKVLLP